MEIIKGTKLKSATPHYENIYVSTDKSGEGFYISSQDLIIILSEFDFLVAKKRTRRWGRINIDDWRIERFDQPRTY